MAALLTEAADRQLAFAHEWQAILPALWPHAAAVDGACSPRMSDPVDRARRFRDITCLDSAPQGPSATGD